METSAWEGEGGLLLGAVEDIAEPEEDIFDLGVYFGVIKLGEVLGSDAGRV